MPLNVLVPLVDLTEFFEGTHVLGRDAWVEERCGWRRRGGGLEITLAVDGVLARQSECARRGGGAWPRRPISRGPSTSYAVAAPSCRAFSPAADAATVVDVASSSPVEDRTKLFFHEATACASPASPFHSEGGPKTIRCGFTDARARAAHDRRFT